MSRIARRLFAPCALALFACTAPVEELSPDAGSTPDAATPDAGAPAFDACDGTCRTPTLAFSAGGESFSFSRAAFGLTPPEKSTKGVWEIYVEAWEGGFTGCPKNDSPTPERTLVLSGLQIPTGAVTRTGADGVGAALLDFAGTIVTGAQPNSKATAVSVAIAAAKTCEGAAPTCAEDARFLALDVTATFAEGTLSGRLFAPHCESFDE